MAGSFHLQQQLRAIWYHKAMHNLSIFAGTVFTEWWWGPLFALIAFSPISLAIASAFVLSFYLVNKNTKKLITLKRYCLIFGAVFITSVLALSLIQQIRYQKEPTQRYTAICQQDSLEMEEKTVVFSQEGSYQETSGGSSVPLLEVETNSSSDYTAYPICPHTKIIKGKESTETNLYHVNYGTRISLRGYSPKGEHWPFYIKTITVE